MRAIVLTQATRVLGSPSRWVAPRRSALLIVKASKPDLVILDVMMPELDGHEVCRTLRADPDTRALPIIILTGKSPVTAHQVSERVGASAHMSKPFSWRQLAEKIRALLA